MMGKCRRNGYADGVSESIGFLLIFTIVILGIGIVTLYGYPMLLAQQVSADEKIMEKNMIVLQNDMKGLTFKTVPYKETSLKIGGGSLAVYNSTYNPTVSKISIYDSAGTVYLDSFRSGDLRYSSQSSETDISVQGGAVVLRRHTEPGSAMLAEPRWFYDGSTNTMVINLISINSTDVMAKSGIGTVQMGLGETGYRYFETSGNVLLDYMPDKTVPDAQDYGTAWDNYFVNTLGMQNVTSSPATLTYKLPLKPVALPSDPKPRLVIKTYDVVIKSL